VNRLLSVAGLLIVLSPPAIAAPVPNVAPRVVNVTSDSAPGWLPSEALEQRVRATTLEYLEDIDAGKYADAYALLAEIDRKDQSPTAFAERVRQFNQQAGAVIERRIVSITWTKDPAHAPLPGVYAAIDLVSRFANIDRHCGYLVMYQAPSGGAFQVMREENNFLDNATASNIARQQSASAVDAAWASVSAHCPGYKSPVKSSGQAVSPRSTEPVTEASTSTIGYPSVQAALTALHVKPGVLFTTENGWTVAEDKAESAIWSFPPPGHPAYPSAVKRWFVVIGGATNLMMAVQCEATKAACDDLVRSFDQLNAAMSANIRSGH